MPCPLSLTPWDMSFKGANSPHNPALRHSWQTGCVHGVTPLGRGKNSRSVSLLPPSFDVNGYRLNLQQGARCVKLARHRKRGYGVPRSEGLSLQFGEPLLQSAIP